MELWNHKVLDWNHVTRHMEGSYGRNGTVISGSSALHVLIGNSSWLPGDLDIIVPMQTEVLLTTFLLEQGYAETGRFRGSTFTYSGTLPRERVIKFRHKHLESRRIDVIVTDAYKHTPSDIALSHHSTPAMNFITATHIHCPFPALTFHGQMAFNFNEGSGYQQGVKVAMKKYAIQWGFTWEGFRPPAVDWNTIVDWRARY